MKVLPAIAVEVLELECLNSVVLGRFFDEHAANAPRLVQIDLKPRWRLPGVGGPASESSSSVVRSALYSCSLKNVFEAVVGLPRAKEPLLYVTGTGGMSNALPLMVSSITVAISSRCSLEDRLRCRNRPAVEKHCRR